MLMAYEQRFDNWLVSDDRALINLEVVHRYLAQSYWSPNITAGQVERQLKHSTLVFGLYNYQPPQSFGGDASLTQVGFARVLSDLCRFAYLSDVFVLPEYQRQGLGQRLTQAVLDHPELDGVRRWVLLTGDAHKLYEKFGFSAPKKPEMYMERRLETPTKWI